MGQHLYRAKIKIIGVNPYVEVPAPVLVNLLQKLGKDSGPIPVRGRIDGHFFKQTIVKYSGRWRLYINGVMRTAAEVDVGDTVAIEVDYDASSREEPMNAAFAQALAKNPAAKTQFEALAPHRRKEILRYLNSLKSHNALQRNITRVIAHLRGQESDALYALMRRQPTIRTNPGRDN